MRKILHYALGGGHGHTLRQLAIAKALRRLSLAEAVLLVPARAQSWLAEEGFEVHSPPAKATSSQQRLARWMAKLLADLDPDLLVVDVFVRGVLGELGCLEESPPRVLVTRWVQPAYYRSKGVFDFLATYQAVLWTEPAPDVVPQRLPCNLKQASIEPVVHVDQYLTRSDARLRLGLSDTTKPVVLVLGTGSNSFQQELRSVLRQRDWALQFASLSLPPDECTVRLWPAGRYLLAADAVVATAGYQSYYETWQSGRPTVYLPRRRKYDQQGLRAQGQLWSAHRGLVACNPEELQQALSCCLQQPPRELEFLTGADQAARFLADRLWPRPDPSGRGQSSFR